MAEAKESKKKIEKSKEAVKKVAQKPMKKAEVKPVEPMVSKKADIKVAKPPVTTANLKVAIVGVDGKAAGNISLPVEIFGQTPNKALIAQAIRVYLANQRQGTASTKTRGEVIGSTRKIYRQKGTGRARHGALKAPLFVGGGVAHGPHPHDFSLKFPKKMKKQALISALSEKAQSGVIRVIDGEFSGKTREVAQLLKVLDLNKKGKADKVLFVVDKSGAAMRAASNMGGVEVVTANTVSTYGVCVNKSVIFLKNAVEELEKRLKN